MIISTVNIKYNNIIEYMNICRIYVEEKQWRLKKYFVINNLYYILANSV